MHAASSEPVHQVWTSMQLIASNKMTGQGAASGNLNAGKRWQRQPACHNGNLHSGKQWLQS
jgi:hypothetical protein